MCVGKARIDEQIIWIIVHKDNSPFWVLALRLLEDLSLSVEFHVQRLEYIKSRSYSLYRYGFDAGHNKHDILLGLSLPRKSQQNSITEG